MHKSLNSALKSRRTITPQHFSTRRQRYRLRTFRPFARRTYPSGHVIDYTRAADGRVTAVRARASAGAAQTDIAAAITWKPFGPLAGLTYGNGLTLARSYDQNYWLTGIALSGTPGSLIAMTIGRDANGNVSSVTDTATPQRNAAYGYSDAGRLASASGVWGADAYLWDANSNRTRADRTVSGTTASDVATIPAASNRLTEIRDGAGVLARSYAYTPGGDRSALAEAGATTSYTYDARGRLATVSSGAGVLATYAYDWREHRVAQTVPGTSQRHYIYDAEGHLLAEHDGATGAVLREYVWLDSMPLATVTGKGTFPLVGFPH